MKKKKPLVRENERVTAPSVCETSACVLYCTRAYMYTSYVYTRAAQVCRAHPLALEQVEHVLYVRVFF